MSLGIWQLLIILLIVIILFGGGRVSKIMTDFAKGIKSFKKELKEEGKDSATAKIQKKKSTQK
ncbi:MAG: twin-arginine translocase TatA/TatE family subunit [Alphaproteobacteria bacterium]|jgi:sec-independent protein translocase protein TatA|nr:twin-arginine translocase TatA/TatE family subunit [Alphaproteobacteria bacterium]MBT5827781.1 twin-arginine translocase TatA/TatE family subunit [Alphaproteobacteria bacterium]